VARFLFDWDEANIEHIGRHRFAPDDVEEVFAEGATAGIWRMAGPSTAE